MSFDAFIARALEEGRVPSALPSRALASAWGVLARVARPVVLPRGAHVVFVGGATLGGSGKTTTALACAMELAHAGARDVAIVGHAYAARPMRAREVSPTDDVREVGDEALACARAIARDSEREYSVARARVRVVVARSRQAAIDFAAQRSRVLVVDGALQAAPQRATRSILALDASAPWGTGEHPPLGDLRAPKRALLDACDVVVLVRDARDTRDERAAQSGACAGVLDADADATARRLLAIETDGDGAWQDDELLPWSALASLRVGLVTSLARPSRVALWLARRGVTPAVVHHGADHRAPSLRALDPGRATSRPLDLWLATPKCAAHLPPSLGGKPVAVLDHRALPSAALLDEIGPP